MDNHNNKPKKPPLADYARYSTIALQMALIIVLTTFAGKWADSLLSLKIPVFTITGILLGVAAAIYLIIKKL